MLGRVGSLGGEGIVGGEGILGGDSESLLEGDEEIGSLGREGLLESSLGEEDLLGRGVDSTEVRCDSTLALASTKV